MDDLIKSAGAFSELLTQIGKIIHDSGEPKRIIKKANAEAEARKILAKTGVEGERLIGKKWDIRLENLNKIKESNLESTIYNSQNYLSNTQISTNLDQDWFLHFISLAQDVSNSEMQNIWSKILAGEFIKPGSFSMRTLNVLKTITKKEAELFEKYCSFVCIIDNNFGIKLQYGNITLNKFGFTLNELILLKDIGLVSNMHDRSCEIKPNETKIIHYYDEKLSITNSSQRIFNYSTDSLTNVGNELYVGIIKNNEKHEKNTDYFNNLFKELENDLRIHLGKEYILKRY